MTKLHEEECTGIFNEGPTCHECLKWVADQAKYQKKVLDDHDCHLSPEDSCNHPSHQQI